MRTLDFETLTTSLYSLGLYEGDVVLCHSALHFLGRSSEGVKLYYRALTNVLDLPTQEHLKTRGTLAVPTFNFAFANGEPYHPRITPSHGMGVFSEYVRQLPWAYRTSHPLQSLAIVGRYAADLASRDTLSAFDANSAFERLLELDAKLLLLGADIQAASMVHYSEQRAAVPYRYWKEFSGQVYTPQGWQQRTYRMFVRDMNIQPQLYLKPVQQELERQGKWHSQALNYGRISVCALRDFVAVADQLLEADPWILVKNRPDI